MGGSRRATAIFVLVLAALLGVPAVAGAASQATAFQLDAAHSGYSADAGVAPPLTARWTVDFGQPVSFPLIVDGRVFVISRNANQYGTVLHALNASTGAELWARPLGGTYYWSGQAYGAGRVYTVNGDGLMSALDAATGATVWATQLPGQYSFTSDPTFYDGVVYTGGSGTGGTLYAVDAASGAVRWSQPVENGDHSSPAVDSARVYVSYACTSVYAFDRRTGAPIWHPATTCTGGGGRTPVLGVGRLFVRDDGSATGTVLDAAAGKVVDSFSSGPTPVIAGSTALYVSDGKLIAQDATNGQPRWSWTPEDGSTVTAAPIAANGVAFAGTSSGALVALDLQTGKPTWRTGLPAPVPFPDEHNASSPVAGLGAGEGLLIVPSGTALVAFAGAGGSSSPPAGSQTPGADGPQAAADARLTFSARHRNLVIGKGTAFTGRLTSKGKPVAKALLQVQVDPFPFDDQWKSIGYVRTGKRGRYAGRLATDRNTRVRVVVKAVPVIASAPVTVYTSLLGELVYKVRPKTGAARLKLAVGGPRDWKPADPRAFVYRLAGRGKALELLATIPLSQKKRGIMAGTGTGKLPPGTRKPRLAFCLPEPADDGFGKPTPADKLCGQPEIKAPYLRVRGPA
jgi:outer membrane protein assembly factor BamB